eukprot:CAMPEP_0170466446 /NCGR_PEP_ID=MMETSP0123-20130129/10404_1 /TAXON_ID=182087 /ORGANISM="Favella ehrenbergii, Strain Fehren 1" /LENGTH=53 /DNA_ID=CAMNT_0010732579 /DNA_START=881 /DNA_END=1042 /DNA_ORIENTATION=+
MDRNLKTVTLTQELALKKMETDLTKGMASTRDLASVEALILRRKTTQALKIRL